MIASLPMYARPSNKGAHDALWALIRDGLRARGVSAPDGLDHDIGHWDSWGREDLVLGQICNLPLRGPFAGQVTPIAASDYGLEDCPAGHYRSHFVVHRDSPFISPKDTFGAKFVINDRMSHSGYGAAQNWAAQYGKRFRVYRESGSHRASITAIADGSADVATIDAQSWRIEAAENPAIRMLKIIGHTDVSPGMTFITAKGKDPAPFYEAITDAIDALDSQNAQLLGIKAIIALPAAAYDLPIPPELAEIAP